MRELKFRIWDHVCGCFTNKPDAYHAFLTNGKPVDLDWALSNKENFTVQQFTGLKDKNGREIYEGDIVRYKYSKRDFFEPCLAFLQFEEKRATYILRQSLSNPAYLMDVDLLDKTFDYEKDGILYFNQRNYEVLPEQFEIVGNVCENPYLVK